MIILFHGSDRRLREKLRSFERAALKKYPGMTVVRITPDVYEPSLLEEYGGGQSLFAPRVLVILDGILDVTEQKKTMCAVLPALADSENVFLCVAGELSPADQKLLETHAKEKHHFPAVQKKKEEFPVFVLANAVAGRNAEKLWVLYHEALFASVAPEALRGMLHWKVRDLMGKGSGGYTKEELSALSRGLIGLFEESEGQTSAEALEAWCLRIEKVT